MSKNGPTGAVLLPQDPEKLGKVQRELDHLREIFKDVNENKRDFVQRHIEQLAWFNVSIADLQAKVDQWGTLVSYDNGGGQTGIKPNPDVKTLLDYQKSCNTIVRTLIPLVPDKYKPGKLDLLLNLEDDDDPESWEQQMQEEEERKKARDEEFKRAGQILKEMHEKT